MFAAVSRQVVEVHAFSPRAFFPAVSSIHFDMTEIVCRPLVRSAGDTIGKSRSFVRRTRAHTYVHRNLRPPCTFFDMVRLISRVCGVLADHVPCNDIFSPRFGIRKRLPADGRFMGSLGEMRVFALSEAIFEDLFKYIIILKRSLFESLFKN